MTTKNKVISHFSDTGTDVRHVYSEDGKTLLGVIYKLGKGRYRVLRMDGKSRNKDNLTDAFKTIRRAN